MKTTVNIVLFFLVSVLIFPSCNPYKLMHYNRSELDKVGPKITDYTVYLHDKENTYKVDNAAVTPAGIKGSITPVPDKATIAEIKNPRTRKQIKRQMKVLNIYVKTEIKEGNGEVSVKKDDINEVSHITKSKAAQNIGQDIGTGFVLCFGVLVWVGVVYSLHGLL